jgi:hypothetical protein
VNLTLFPGYLLDANTVIQHGRRINPPELRASANVIVNGLISQGRILSPLEACKELEAGAKDKGDEVLLWVQRNKTIFIELTDTQQGYLADVLAQFPNLVKYDSQGYDADPILVAMAMDKPGWTVVTRDGFNSKGKAGVKQACEHYKIPCMTEHDMLKANGWSI